MPRKTAAQRQARRDGTEAANAGLSKALCPFRPGERRREEWLRGYDQALGIDRPAAKFVEPSPPPKPMTIDGVYYESRNEAERELGSVKVREHLRGVTA